MNTISSSVEYESLRQEILQSLQRQWQTRVAALSSSALLLGLVGATNEGFHGAIAWFVPSMLFILCNTAAAGIAKSRSKVTRIGVYIELQMESSTADPPCWERTISELHSDMKHATPLQTAVYLFRSDPLPWLSILHIAMSYVIFTCVLQNHGIGWALLYAVVHSAQFIFLLCQLYGMRWVDRDKVRAEVRKVLETRSHLANSLSQEYQSESSNGENEKTAFAQLSKGE